MGLSALLLGGSRFLALLLFLALVGLLFRRLLLGHRLLGLRLLGLALLPPGQLPDRALDATSGLLGGVAHCLGGALDATSGLLGRVAHCLGGALDATSGLLGRVAHRLGGALDGGPADLTERLRASGQPVGYGGHPAEHGLRSGLLRGLHQRAANLLHDLRGLLGLSHLGGALPRHAHRLRASLVAAEPRRQGERGAALLSPAQYVAADHGRRQFCLGGLALRRRGGVLFFGHCLSLCMSRLRSRCSGRPCPGLPVLVGAAPVLADLRHFLLPGIFAFGVIFAISFRLLNNVFTCSSGRSPLVVSWS